MSLTPATTDPEYVNEMLRRAKDPQSFGIGGLTDAQKKQAEQRVSEHNKASSGRK